MPRPDGPPSHLARPLQILRLPWLEGIARNGLARTTGVGQETSVSVRRTSWFAAALGGSRDAEVAMVKQVVAATRFPVGR